MGNIFNATVAVIGLGYVGLPLAVNFGKRYPTVGYDGV
jgi:UDP-N-acetyl-D-galactosamine dehydrogenase